MKLGSFFLIVAIIMSEDSVAQRINLEYWMRDLPEPLKNVPLIYLAIPGSHDSMTYNITQSSTLAPDADPVLHLLYTLSRSIILQWTITQTLDPVQQLLIGIRYFDLRLATKNDTEEFFFTHGLYAGEITKPLDLVKEFVISHPGEVVILDFQHFYGFARDDHLRLMRVLRNMFGPLLVPRHLDLHVVTLNALSRFRQQIIIVYRNQLEYATNEFWQTQMMPSPWPQKDSTRGLIDYLENLRRHPGMGFVHQAVLTPTAPFIARRWNSTLRKECAVPVIKDVLPRIAEFSPGPPRSGRTGQRSTLNIVIADFVELNDAAFPLTIIQLNQKLLRELEENNHRSERVRRAQ